MQKIEERRARRKEESYQRKKVEIYQRVKRARKEEGREIKRLSKQLNHLASCYQAFLRNLARRKKEEVLNEIRYYLEKTTTSEKIEKLKK